MPDGTTENATDGPNLSDCKTLIARIDGTMEALMRERSALARRVSALSNDRPGEEQRDAE